MLLVWCKHDLLHFLLDDIRRRSSRRQQSPGHKEEARVAVHGFHCFGFGATEITRERVRVSKQCASRCRERERRMRRFDRNKMRIEEKCSTSSRSFGIQILRYSYLCDVKLSLEFL